jgi:hypothetical protein
LTVVSQITSAPASRTFDENHLSNWARMMV